MKFSEEKNGKRWLPLRSRIVPSSFLFLAFSLSLIPLAHSLSPALSRDELIRQAKSLSEDITRAQQRLASSQLLTSKTWRLTAAVFVFLMQLGFSLIEAGTVRFKNTRNIMIKNVLDTCVSAAAFWLFGYGIAFGEGSRIFGWSFSGSGKTAFAGNEQDLELFFQFTFCATSATVFAGAVAERTQLAAYLFYNFIQASVIYPVIAHIVWSDNGLFSPTRQAVVLGTNGVIDNAGSMVVHVTGGVISLVAAWMVGPRLGRFDLDGKVVPFRGFSLVFIATGTIILWLGFFGFNGGSVDFSPAQPLLWADEVAAVCVNTSISAAFGGVTVWLLTYRNKEPTPEDTFNGVLGGLVAACATSSVVEPYAAVVIGIVSGVVYLFGVSVLFLLKIDDPVNAAPVHLGCGSWGAIAAGLFATEKGIKTTFRVHEVRAYGLIYSGSFNLLFMQLIGLLSVYVWVGLSSFVLFFVLHFFDVLRVKRHEEEVGLDVAFHGGDDDALLMDGEEEDRRTNKFMNWKRLQKLHGGFWHSSGDGNRGERSPVGGDAGKGQARGGGLMSLLSFSPVLSLLRSNMVSVGGKRDTWHRAIDKTHLGQFSLSMYEGNYVMEDTVEVESSSLGVYLAVHDGHNGNEAAVFLKETLFSNLKRNLLSSPISAEVLKRSFLETDAQFSSFVERVFEDNPHLATVGACSVVAFVSPGEKNNGLWVANVGDCRAVLGQVRTAEDGFLECRALQLSVDHNLSFPEIRSQFISEHADVPDAVTEKRGRFRVKGKVSVTRAFGDLHLKHREFNREPLFTRFRVPEPFPRPLLSAEPHVSFRSLSPHDQFLVVASDGLFDCLTNQEVVDEVASAPKKDIARHLIRCALRRVSERVEVTYPDLLRMKPGLRREFHDDFTVVVFFFEYDAIAAAGGGGVGQWGTSWAKGNRSGSTFFRDLSLKGGFSLPASSSNFHTTNGSTHAAVKGEVKGGLGDDNNVKNGHGVGKSLDASYTSVHSANSSGDGSGSRRDGPTPGGAPVGSGAGGGGGDVQLREVVIGNAQALANEGRSG